MCLAPTLVSDYEHVVCLHVGGRRRIPGPGEWVLDSSEAVWNRGVARVAVQGGHALEGGTELGGVPDRTQTSLIIACLWLSSVGALGAVRGSIRLSQGVPQVMVVMSRAVERAGGGGWFRIGLVRSGSTMPRRRTHDAR